MQAPWMTAIAMIVEWALYSIALNRILQKLGAERRWRAWLPGSRYNALGESVGMNEEGSFAGILDILIIALSVAAEVVTGRAQTIILLAILIAFVLLFIYRIRFFLRLNDAFGLKSLWIVLWVLAGWIAMMIVGFGEKYRVREDFRIEEEWEPGVKPAEIAQSSQAAAAGEPVHDGLRIDIDSRTVKEHGKKKYLLKDIHLTIPNKSMVMLLGGSGAGKTTFINAAIGYEKADAKVFLNGSDVYEDYDSVKYRIGFVPQQNLIRGKDTVKRTVSDAAAMRLPTSLTRKETKARISDVLDLLGLTAGKSGLVAKKSGGQQRRISIAMELVADPELFVLDEPDSGLDGAIAKEIFHKLRAIADEGRIVIVITHTPDRVVDLFDKVIVLARDSGRVGRLAFYGTPQEAREFFEKDTMEDIVVRINSIDAGGEGLADEYIERFAGCAASEEGGAAS